MCCTKAENAQLAVDGCINADFCNQILILQHFSRSTKLLLYLAKFSKVFKLLQKINGFRKKSASFLQKSGKFCRIFRVFQSVFCEFLQNFANFSKNQLDNRVDFENCCKMRIWLQNFVSIQPRTSLEKSDVSWPVHAWELLAARMKAAKGLREHQSSQRSRVLNLEPKVPPCAILNG